MTLKSIFFKKKIWLNKNSKSAYSHYYSYEFTELLYIVETLTLTSVSPLPFLGSRLNRHRFTVILASKQRDKQKKKKKKGNTASSALERLLKFSRKIDERSISMEIAKWPV